MIKNVLNIMVYELFKCEEISEPYHARLAQSVERWTLNPTVVGSSPTLGEMFCYQYAIGISHFENHMLLFSDHCFLSD